MSQAETDEREKIARKRDDNIGKLFKHAARDFNDCALYKLRERGYHELTMFHTALISNLDIEGTRISVLAERAVMSKQAMGQIVKELESQGYIRRAPDPDDKRAYIIHFTEKGWEFLQAAYAVKTEIESEYTQIIGEDGMQALQQLLGAIVEDRQTSD